MLEWQFFPKTICFSHEFHFSPFHLELMDKERGELRGSLNIHDEDTLAAERRGEMGDIGQMACLVDSEMRVGNRDEDQRNP